MAPHEGLATFAAGPATAALPDTLLCRYGVRGVAGSSRLQGAYEGYGCWRDDIVRTEVDGAERDSFATRHVVTQVTMHGRGRRHTSGSGLRWLRRPGSLRSYGCDSGRSAIGLQGRTLSGGLSEAAAQVVAAATCFGVS